MDKSSRDTLDTIERCLVADAVSVKSALEAAYFLGKIDGQMEMAKVGEKVVQELSKAPS